MAKERGLSRELENGKVFVEPYKDVKEKRAKIRYEGEGYQEEDIKLSKKSLVSFINTLEESELEEAEKIKQDMLEVKGEAQKLVDELGSVTQVTQMKQQTEEIQEISLDNFTEDSIDMVERGITGRVGDTFYLTAWFSDRNSYQPVIITSNLEFLEPKYKLAEVKKQLAGSNQELSDEQEKRYDYYYVRIEDKKVNLGSDFPKKPSGINHLDEKILYYLKPEEFDSIQEKDELDLMASQGLDAETLWEKLIEFLQKIFDHREDKWYDVLAAHSIHTYLIQVIGFSPYLVFVGQPQTGKSHIQKSLANIDYNGKFMGNATPTVVTRLSDEYQASLHQDEIDKMSDSRKKQLLGLYNTGYDKGGSYIQTDMNGESTADQIKEINSFCPKTLSGNSFKDEWVSSFKSRCIRISTVRTNRNDLKDIKDLEIKYKDTLECIRNAIGAYCVKNWSEILEDIRVIENKINANDRSKNQYAMYQGIVNHFSPSRRDVKSFLESNKNLNETGNPFSPIEDKMVEVIIATMGESSIVSLKLQNIADAINNDVEGRDISSKEVKNALKRVNFLVNESQLKDTSSGVSVDISREIIVDSLERLEVKDDYMK